MKTKLLLLLSVLLLFSCSSPQKLATKHFNKSIEKHEPTTARLAIQRWPSKDSVSVVERLIPGETKYIPGETKYVNCDSIAEKKGGKAGVVHVPCPPSFYRVDTAKITEYYRYEDERKALLFKHEKDSLIQVIVRQNEAHIKEVASLEADNKAIRKDKRRWQMLAITFMAYMAIRIFTRIQFPLIYKFLP